MSGLRDPAKGLEMAEVTSMHLLLSGNLSDSNGIQRTDVRVVDVRSGEISLAEKRKRGQMYLLAFAK